MKILVEALETYEKNNISDSELKRTPKTGEQFEVTEERLKVLLGNNTHNQVFVKIVEDNTTVKTIAEQIIEEEKEEANRIKKKSKNKNK